MTAIGDIDLTRPPLIAAVSVMTVVAVVLVGVLLPRAARRRPSPSRHVRGARHGSRRAPARGRLSGAGRFLRRVAAVSLSSILVLASCALAVNQPMHYVTTVAELVGALGMSGPDYSAATPILPTSDEATSSPTAGATVTPSASPAAAASPTPDPAWVATFTPVGDGSEVATWTGPTSGISLPVRVILPSGYAPDDGRTYDVVEFLHGSPGDVNSIVDGLAFPQALQAAIDAGQIPPTIVVVPSLNVDSYSPDCADLTGRPAVGTWVASEVPQMIRTTFPNVTADRAGWMIAGLSSGAYCAGWTALTSSGTFGAAGMFSGYDAPVEGGLAASTSAVRQANTLSTMITASRADAVHFYVLGARDDSDARAVADRLAASVHEPDTVTTDEPTSGGHSWPLWVAALPRLLAWWGADAGVQAAAHPATTASPSPSPQPTPTATPTATATPSAAAGSSPTPGADDDGSGTGSVRRSLTAVNGGGLIAVVWALAVTGIGALALLGPRWVPRRPTTARRLACATGRVLAVGAVGLLVAAAVGLSVNAAGGFYTSWADLWSTLTTTYL